MKRYIKPMTEIPDPEAHTEENKKVRIRYTREFDVEKLLEHCGEILRREVRSLMVASSSKKLDAVQARDLVAYTKLLHELKNEQKAELKNLTDAELEALVQKASPELSDQNKE